ncbi:hypothetical protein AVEN_224646-1 [Araneus ventricosus]|uniref:Uncharacterized protein n=1 Tax=Araneus ventricosus TaxID=182803 RepID=A0A4Y2TJR8_ARAVE|nr:hypothetical protein AVEN_224646-1 [Araneus ventricosus]
MTVHFICGNQESQFVFRRNFKNENRKCPAAFDQRNAEPMHSLHSSQISSIGIKLFKCSVCESYHVPNGLDARLIKAFITKSAQPQITKEETNRLLDHQCQKANI